MKVKEALQEVFKMEIREKKRWEYEDGKYGLQSTGQDGIDTEEYMDSLAQDRNVLESNFDSDVLMLDHTGFVGLMGFKMRNGRPALFMFNNPKSIRCIQRVEGQKTIDSYNSFKESMGTDHNLKNEEFELWLSLKIITGGGFK